ncbi:Fungal specific transcription factor domain [Ceratobasidium sp. AG-Ba]|nr:Fungal specific transcription factor domain [Ceratobasidium sp. AG-Ba]QRW04168.1 Fungal specific transcription factor domain [Ceratobasidium sp. AG-Ba]
MSFPNFRQQDKDKEAMRSAPDTVSARTEQTQRSPWLVYLNKHFDTAANRHANVSYQFIFNIDSSIPPNEQSEGSYRSLVCDWSRHLPSLDGIQFTRLEHDTLLDRCFKYSSCWLMSVVPQFFLLDMLRALAYAHEPPEINHYSPLLHCSLLAFATAFSDDPLIKQPATRNRFAEKAKYLLHDELRQPNLCLAQSLIFLSEYHCGLGESERGYMYLGIGIHSVRALGTSKLDLRSAETSSWCFWSIFSQDMNMDSDLRSTSHLAMELPRIDWEIDQLSWAAPSSTTEQASRSRITQVFVESCKLMLIAESIIRLHQTVKPVASFAGDSRVTDIHWKLDAWLSELPTELLISDHPSIAHPHIIMINMAYWWFVLLLHQPYYRLAPDRNAPPVSTTRPFGDLSDVLCDRAAEKIMHLVDLYGQWHGLRFFPRNMIQVVYASPHITRRTERYDTTQVIKAVGILRLRQLAFAPEPSGSREASLKCITALRTISHTWQCAEKYMDHLQKSLGEQGPQPSTHAYATPEEHLYIPSISTSWQPGSSVQQLRSAVSEHESNPVGYGSSYSHSSHEELPQ